MSIEQAVKHLEGATRYARAYIPYVDQRGQRAFSNMYESIYKAIVELGKEVEDLKKAQNKEPKQ